MIAEYYSKSVAVSSALLFKVYKTHTITVVFYSRGLDCVIITLTLSGHALWFAWIRIKNNLNTKSVARFLSRYVFYIDILHNRLMCSHSMKTVLAGLSHICDKFFWFLNGDSAKVALLTDYTSIILLTVKTSTHYGLNDSLMKEDIIKLRLNSFAEIHDYV